MIMLRTVAILILPLLLSPLWQENLISQAEKLFAGRDQAENLRQAIASLESARTRDPSNYEVLWRLGKYRYYLADSEPDKTTRQKLFEAGIEVAKQAVASNPARPEGHFWLAANYGEYASLTSGFKSLWLLKTIRKELEAVLRIDPAYESGSTYLALGQMQIELPRLLGGDDDRGIKLFEAGLKVGSTNADLKVTLADQYLKRGKKEAARPLLESVLRVDDPLRTRAEQQELRDKARHRLDQLK